MPEFPVVSSFCGISPPLDGTGSTMTGKASIVRIVQAEYCQEDELRVLIASDCFEGR